MLRNPNSIPSGDTIIQDPVMEPFFITRSQTGGYTVYERVTKGENNTEYIKTICYPGNFNHALKSVQEKNLIVVKKLFIIVSKIMLIVGKPFRKKCCQ